MDSVNVGNVAIVLNVDLGRNEADHPISKKKIGSVAVKAAETGGLQPFVRTGIQGQTGVSQCHCETRGGRTVGDADPRAMTDGSHVRIGRRVTFPDDDGVRRTIRNVQHPNVTVLAEHSMKVLLIAVAMVRRKRVPAVPKAPRIDQRFDQRRRSARPGINPAQLVAQVSRHAEVICPAEVVGHVKRSRCDNTSDNVLVTDNHMRQHGRRAGISGAATTGNVRRKMGMTGTLLQPAAEDSRDVAVAR